MATLEELVVQLVAETGGLRAELDKATKAVSQNTEKMDKAIEEFSGNSKKNVSIFEQAWATAMGFLGSQAVIGVFNQVQAAAGALFEELVVKGVESAIEAENAQNKFNTALALTGKYSKSTSMEFKEFTDGIEHNSNVTAEAALEAGSLIQSLGNLEKEGLKKATQAAVDMSAALGIDLQSAAKLVGKAATGEVASFSKFGLKLDEGRTKSETFEKALTALNNKFGGAASAQINTYAGQVNQLNNRWGDITEVFGRAVIENQTLLEVIKEINKILGEGVDGLEGNEQAMKELVGQGIIILIESAMILTASLDALNRTFQVLYSLSAGVRLPLTAVTAAFIGVTEGSKGLDKYLTSVINNTIDGFSAFGKTGDNTMTVMTDRLADLKLAAQTGFDKLKSGADSAVEPVVKATGKVAELSEEQKKANALLQSYAVGLAEQTMALDANYQYQLEMLQTQKDAELLTEQEFLDARLVMLTDQELYEQSLLEDSKAKKLITAQQYADAKTALDRKYKIENAKQNAEITKAEIAEQKTRSDNFRSTMGVIATLAQSSSKELAAIGKAAAITQATIDGYAAVQKALASAPPPINFALAAAVGVATAANVAKIAGVGLKEGGTIVGGGANEDTVPAALAKGETVISRGLTDQLERFLNEGSQQSTRIVVEVSYRDSALMDFIETKIVERERTGQSLLSR